MRTHGSMVYYQRARWRMRITLTRMRGKENGQMIQHWAMWLHLFLKTIWFTIFIFTIYLQYWPCSLCHSTHSFQLLVFLSCLFRGRILSLDLLTLRTAHPLIHFFSFPADSHSTPLLILLPSSVSYPAQSLALLIFIW